MGKIMTNRYTINKEFYNSVSNKLADEILQCIKYYHVELRMNDAIELVNYENHLKKALTYEDFQLNQNGLITLLSKKEKKSFYNAMTEELNNINSIKKIMEKKIKWIK